MESKWPTCVGRQSQANHLPGGTAVPFAVLKLNPSFADLSVGFAQKRRLVLIHTRLQPGDRERQENRKPFKTVSSLSLAQFTWLKPGVNEIKCPREFDSLRWCKQLFVQNLSVFILA